MRSALFWLGIQYCTVSFYTVTENVYFTARVNIEDISGLYFLWRFLNTAVPWVVGPFSPCCCWTRLGDVWQGQICTDSHSEKWWINLIKRFLALETKPSKVICVRIYPVHLFFFCIVSSLIYLVLYALKGQSSEILIIFFYIYG